MIVCVRYGNRIVDANAESMRHVQLTGTIAIRAKLVNDLHILLIVAALINDWL